MTRVPLDQAMQMALAHHQAGRLPEAEEIYRKVLAANPDHFEALQLLGTLAKQTGRLTEAIELLSRALAIDPNVAAVWTNLAFAHYATGDYVKSLAAAERALQLNPQLPPAYLARGATLVAVGRHEEAVAMWNRLIVFNANDAEAHSNLGATLEMLGRIDDALASCQRAVALKPDYAMARVNLGSVLLKLNRPAEAAEQQRQAIRLDPNLAPAYVNLANAAQQLGRLDEAAAASRRAVELTPDDVNANLTAALHEGDDLDRAAAYFTTAVSLLEAQALHQAPPAAAASRQFAARLRLTAAVLLPAVYESHEELTHWRNRLRDSLAQLQRENVKVQVDHDPAPTLFALAYHGLDDVDIARTFASLVTAPQPPLRTRPLGGRKIRVGLISRFFNNHTIGRLNMGVVAELSRNDFEVTVLAAGSSDDQFGTFIRKHADTFHTLPPLLSSMRDFIASLELDVLFYTDLGMDPTTLSLAFSRLAPVQCVTWGHPVTTGISTIDYYISSEQLESPGSEAQYIERLVRLPTLAVHYYRPILPRPQKSRADFKLSADATIYGCLQMLWKFHPDFDALIAGVLRRDPRGRVIIIEGFSKSWQTKLLSRLRRSMPDVVDRIQFLPRQSYGDFLHLVSLCDVSLDPYPFGGGNTTYEALAFGVPVVTLPTQFLRGRISKALYDIIGVDDCIARDADHYIDIAVALGTNPAERQRVHDKINGASGALFENPAGVRALEAFLKSAVAQTVALT